MICPIPSASSSRAQVSSWIIFDQEAPRGIVVAAVPEGVERGGEVVEIEGDAVRLVRLRRRLDHARELRGELDQRQLLGVEQRQVGRRVEIDAGLGRLALSEQIRAWAYWT